MHGTAERSRHSPGCPVPHEKAGIAGAESEIQFPGICKGDT